MNRFISKNETFSSDGVTYTAISNAQLNLDDDGKVSGLASGKVTAVVTSSENSPVLMLDASDSTFNFTADGQNSTLDLTLEQLGNRAMKFTSGTATVTKTSISTGAVKFSVAGTASAADYEFTVKDAATFNLGTTSFSVSSENFSVAVTGSTSTFNFDVSGTATRDLTNHTFSITKGTSIATTLGGYTATATADDNLGAGFALDTNGITFTPNSSNGSIGVAVALDGSAIFSNDLLISNGSITLGYDGSITLAKDTSFEFTTSNGYVFTATATDTATASIATTDNKVTVTPAQDNGSLDITIKRDDTNLFSGNLAISGGSLSFDSTTKAITVTQGTTATVTQGNYSFTLTATDAAGAKVSVLDDGNFEITPGTGDGKLNISVARNGTTIFDNTVNIEGSIILDKDKQTFTFSEGTKTALTVGDYTVSLTAVGDTSLEFSVKADGTVVIASSEGNGSVDVSITQGDTVISHNTVNINGTLIFNPEDQTIKINDGTKISVAFSDMTIRLDLEAADGDISGKISLEDGKFLYTPDKDGKALNINLVLTDEGTDVDTIPISLATTNGSFGIDFANNAFFFSEGNTFEFALDEYNLGAEVIDGDANISVRANGDGSFKITPGKDDGALKVNLTRAADSKTIFDGTLKIDGSINFGGETVHDMPSFSMDAGTTISFTQGEYEFIFTDTDSGSIVRYSFGLDGEIIIYPEGDSVPLNIAVKYNGTSIFDNNIELIGGCVFNFAENTFGLTYGSQLITTIDDYKFTVTAPPEKNTYSIFSFNDGKLVLSPYEGSTTIYISLSKGDTTILDSDEFTIYGGSITFDPTANKISVADGTEFSREFGDYTINIKVNGEAASAIELTDDGLTITPATGDGTLDVTLSNSSDTLSANLEILSGSFTLGENGSLTVAKDTELQIDFGDGYVVDFKTTGEAGGKISLGDDGIKFTPDNDDGHLEISVTKDGSTRTASLEMIGSVTYKLDGSITLAKGTVLKNTFEDGNELTITAKTDAGGSIIFNPTKGLTITPSTPDALEVVLSNNGFEVANFSSIDGTINYSSGVVTAEDGAQSHLSVYDTWEAELSTTGGTSSIAFMSDRTVYTANDGATFVLDYLDGSTLEIQNGSFSDIYATETEDAIELISEGSNFKTNDDEFNFTLEKAGNYTLNGMQVTTTADNVQVRLSNYDTITFDEISYTPLDENVKLTIDGTTATVTGGKVSLTIDGLGKQFNFDTTDGALNCDSSTKKFTCAVGTSVYLQDDNTTIKLTAKEDFSASYKIEEEIFYFMLDDSAKATMSVVSGGQTLVDNATFEVGGVFSYRPETGTFGLTGANSSHGDGTNTFVQLTLNGQIFRAETNDTTLVLIPTYNDGKFEFKFPNEDKHAMKFTVSQNGQSTFESNITVDGTLDIDTATQEISLTKDTVITISQGNQDLEITALDDAGGKLTLKDDGIRFAPNADDGKLELNFVDKERKASLNVTGAIVFGNNGKISLEKGTEINIAWEDGTELQLTSKGSTGSIALDSDKGLKITSDDENLDMKLTTAGFSTDISAIKGSLWYNAGVVSFDENSKLTATTTLGGQPIFTTLETVGGTGHISFNTTNGVLYAADTGALKVTWSKDDLESTFIVNSGSVQLGHNLFRITEGSDIATDLKNFVPAFYFTTAEAGKYTINGQTITTTAEGLALTATDDYMSFTTSDDVVEYDGMNFAGSGNVSLKADDVVLGAGVKATGFGEGNSFVLAEAGNVTVDSKIFEMEELDTPIKIPMEVTVTGAQDGFFFSYTATKESEAYIDGALTEEAFENYSSPYIGKVFTEKFFSAGDSSYRIKAIAIGLQEVIGISDGATVTGGAIFDGEDALNVYSIVTDTEGTFTLGDKVYKVGGDSEVTIRAWFDENASSTISSVDNLTGTISGDFTGDEFKINGSSGIQVLDDTDISIAADESGYKIYGLDDRLKVSATDTYTVNGSTINANAGDYIMGRGDDYAYLVAINNNTLVTGTESDEYISNYGKNVTINALGGNDTVRNYGASDVTINGGDGDDRIFNVDNFSFSKNEIISSSDNVSIYGGAGNDSIDNNGNNVTINAGEGNDFIENNSDDVIINGGDGDDTIYNHGDDITIDAGLGNNSINNNSANVVFVYGGGNDTISGFNENSVLSLGSDYSTLVQGEDVIVNVGENKIVLKGATNLDNPEIVGASGVTLENRTNDTLISGTSDNDSIANYGTNSTIQALGGNDTVLNEVASVSVDGGNGNDTIRNGSAAYQSTLLGNLGNDSIENYGDMVSIDGGAGNDSIENYGDYSNVDGGDGRDTILNESKHTTIDGGKGNDSIYNGDAADNVSVNGGDGDDTIRNQHAYNVTLDGGPGNDKIIVVTGDHTTINGGDGNDTILGETLEGGSSTWAMGGYSNIDGGDGDDYIDPIYSDSASINGGTGNDTIINEGNDATLNGGAGDDVISLRGASIEGTVIKYEAGDGNDVIYGFNETTKLSITSGTEYSTVESGDDVIVNVGSNEITIAGGKNLSTINIINYDIPALNITNTDNNTSIVGSTLNDTINNSGSSVTIQGLAGDDSIISSGANSSVNGGAGSDSIFNSGANSTLLGDYGNDYLSNSAENVLISGGYGNDTIENSGDNVTVTAGNGFNLTSNTGDNVLFNFGGGIDTIVGFKENSTLSVGSDNFTTIEGIKNVAVISGKSATVLKDALLNDDSININGEAHELGKEIYLETDGDEASISRSNVSIYSGTGDDQISLTANAKNDTIIYNPDDGNDTIYGFNETTKLTISDRPFSAETSGDDLIVTVGESKITLINAASLSANVSTVYDPLTLDVMALRKTEAGYPVMAEVAFHPNEYLGPEPTNYAAKEDWTITSADNLKLHAICYTPENSGDKWAVLIHGYGKDHKAMYTTATAYLDNGYNVLLIDQRAAGESEGEWLTMGAAESQDVALWTQEIVRRNSDAKIALHGVSMGAATAILAAARSDTKNVTALIDDCGYTNVMAVFDIINAAMLKQADTVVAAMDPVAEVLTGYYLHDAAPIDSIPSAKMPSLFITGSADVVAPVSMLNELYDASGAEVKEKYIAEGIEHGRVAFDNPANYSNAVFRFIAEANEEGWVTNNTVSSISLRGTSYDDSITNSGDNVTIDSGAGNDTITNSGSNVSIDAGKGNNLVSLNGTSEVIVFSGDTTVEGFKTGFGEGADTVYITSNPAGVDFKDGVLAFYNDNASLTMSDLTTTAKVNIYHEKRQMLNRGVFIAEDAWYKVEDSDLSVSSGEEVYFVGPSATAKHGVDFSGISSDLNLTLDTAYIDSEDYVPGTSIWINGVYSIKGGAGLTTITGSNLDDTIIAGSGSTTINASGGDDLISLTSSAALINYSKGDGNDTIYGFNENSQLSISGGYSSVRVGDDVIFSVGDNSITVVDASSVIAVDFEDGDSFLMTRKGAVTVDGKVFELTKNVSSGVTITGTKDGFTSGIIDDEGKVFVEEFVAEGDDSYTVQVDGKGVETISGIDAGTEVITNAIQNRRATENEIIVVTEDAGNYTFNDMEFTTSKDNTAIRLRPQAMAFDAADGVVYDGKTFTGSGNVTVSTKEIALGNDVSASGFDKDEFILAQKGTTTVDGREFELTEEVPEGITIAASDNGYTFSHAITQEEVTEDSLSSSYVGKVFSEEFTVQGDDSYSLQADTFGLRRVSGISGGSTILGGDTSVDGGSDSKVTGQFFYVDTETEGAFTLGEKTYTISGDSNVEIVAVFDSLGYGFAYSFASLDGTVSGDFDGDEFYVNGKKDPILISGDDSMQVVGSSSGTKLYGVSDGATLASLGGVKEVHTDTEGVFTFGTEDDSLNVSVIGDDSVTFKLDSDEFITNIDDVEGDLLFSETSNTVLINGMGGTFDGEFSSISAYDNSLYIHDVANGSSFTTEQADKIWLQMLGETMTLNGNELTLTGDADGIWLRDKEIVGLDEGASLQVSEAGTYSTSTTTFKAKAGDVIVGLENGDAYVYNEAKPPITSETSDAELIEHFNPKNYTVASGAQNISLGGGDLAIVENTSAQVSLTASDRTDTVVSRGENVHVSLTGGNTQMFPLSGKMTLDNYDASTGAGFNFAGTNVLAWIENGAIDFNNGTLKLDSAQVDLGASSELMNFYNIVGRQQKVGWASQSDSLDASNETADLLLVAKKYGSVTGGSGDDTILAQGGNYIDGGAGANFVSISSEDTGSHIVLDGRTTVEGFKTGFGTGTDTVYITGDPAVDFKSGGLTFYEYNDKFTLRDVNETAKVNLYYANIDWLRKGVFIADDAWYSVAEDDLAVRSDEGVYFVGATAKKITASTSAA